MIKGNNPTLLNVRYVGPNKETGHKAYFDVIYKTENGEIRRSTEPPIADIYIVKPEFRDFNYNKPQEKINRMNKYEVEIPKIIDFLIKESGEYGERIKNNARSMNDKRLLKQVLKWPYAYGCDFQPEFYYMKKWYSKYPMNVPNLTTAFMDIEVDMIDYTVDLNRISNSAFAPVNLISIILEDTKEAWQFILNPYEPSKSGLNDEEYKQRCMLYEKQRKSHEWLLSHKNEYINKLHKEFDSTYGDLKYNFRCYKNEIDLIADAFRLINTRKPNFCLCWNMRFDIQYLYYRIQELGYDPKSIMCSPEIPYDERQCYFVCDNFQHNIEKQFDSFICSSYTTYLCQMRNYASIRKSGHKIKSLRLNAIADRELKDHKVEYPENSNITTFAYIDWMLFMIYNVKDTLLQLGIERKTKDIKTFYMRAHTNLTPYNKIFKETHLLRNVRELYFNKQGLVQGNNINILSNDNKDEAVFYDLTDDDISDSKISYKGAINADPVWNADIGMLVNGMRTNNIFKITIDFDMGSFYPSIKIACNMDGSTLIFKAAFINDEFISYEMTNRSLNNKYTEKDKNGNMRSLDITGEAINTYVSENILTTVFNYLNIPSIDKILTKVEKEMNR